MCSNKNGRDRAVLGRSKRTYEKLADFSKRCTAARYDSSSRVTAAILSFFSLAILLEDRSDPPKKQLLVVIRAQMGMYYGAHNRVPGRVRGLTSMGGGLPEA